MSLDELRAAQHEDVTMTSDAELELFLNTVNPTRAALDRLAHATEWELHAAKRTWRP